MKADIRRAVLDELEIAPLPEAALRVQRLSDDPKATAKDIASVISTDSTLTALLLKQANSPFYGFPRKIGTVSLAVVVLGFDAVREISLSTVSMHHSSNAFDPSIINTQRFWSHSLAVATASRIIATRWRTSLPGEAFVAGLLHDIGKLVLATHWSDQYTEVLNRIQSSDEAPHEVEQAIFGTNHSEVAQWLGERWQLPDKMIEAVSLHHSPIEEIKDPFVRTVYISNILAHKAGFRLDRSLPHPKLPEELLEDFAGFDEKSIIEEAKDSYRKAESLLDVIASKTG